MSMAETSRATQRSQEVDVCDLYQDSRVFKVSHINTNNVIKQIYVFCGNQIMKQMPDGSEMNMNAFMADIFGPKYAKYHDTQTLTDSAHHGAIAGIIDAISEIDRKIMSPFFRISELANIVLKRISVLFVNERIHLDDTVRAIKRKILRVSQLDQSGRKQSVDQTTEFSIDEMYLFGKQCVSSFTTQTAYESLTRAGRDIITRIRMDNFIANIDNLDSGTNDVSVSEECKSKQYGSGSGSGSVSGVVASASCPGAITLPQKEAYVYDDVRDLVLECKTQVVNVNLGHAFLEDGFSHVFAVSPFVDSAYNPDVLRVPATNTDNRLLMECGLFLFNTIFMCTAHDVLVYSADIQNKEDRSGYKALKIYFPFLADKMENAKFDISASTLGDNIDFRATLSAEVRADMADTAFSRDCANVNLFYDVYDKRITTVVNPTGGVKSFSYAEQGISFLHVVAKPAAYMVFPIDAVFKTVCTSSELVFIKLNHASRDNLYKIHSPQVNRFGNKVPFLTTAQFNKINKLCVKSGRISLYFSNFKTGIAATHCEELVCEFDTVGQMFVVAKMRVLCSASVVDEVIRSTVNPVISMINRVLGRSGFSISPYVSVYDVPRVHVINMAYTFLVSSDNLVNVKKIFGCGYSIFNNAPITAAAADQLPAAHAPQTTSATTTVLNMKRISNFNEQRHIDLFISRAIGDMDLELVGSGSGANADADADADADAAVEDALTLIAHEVMQHFGLNVDDAHNRVRDVRAASGSDSLGGGTEIKRGMRVTISRVRTETSNVTITVENINNIFYLCTFPIYIDSILRIFHKECTTIPEALIKEMCFTSAPPPASSSRRGMKNVEVPEVAATASAAAAAAPAVNAEPKKAFFDFLPVFGDDGDNSDDSRSGSESGSSSNSSRNSRNSSKGRKNKKGAAAHGGLKGGAKGGPKGAAKERVGSEDEGTDDEGATSGQYDKYPFLKRLQAIDDVLFFKSTDKNENAYSRCCQKRTKAHNHAHPVALTDAEMIQFEKDNPEFVTRGDEYPLHPEDMSKTSFYRYSEVVPADQPGPVPKKPKKDKAKQAEDKPDNDKVVVNAIRYGLTRDKARWYICPRFWDLRKNKFISERAVIAAHPPDPKTGKFNALPQHIYEFESGKEPYVQLYPGFVEQDNAGRHLRMPCCFGKSLNNIRLTADERAHPDRIPHWKKQIADGIIVPPYMEQEQEQEQERRSGLGSAAAAAAPASPDTGAAAAAATAATALKTIFEPSKMPIDAHRLGYLPVPLQKFMFSSMSEHSCGAVGEQCLLRRGVEKNKRQSFIGAIAYIYSDYLTNKKKAKQTVPVPSIKEMLRIIMASITLDTFITYHNGSLITQFQHVNGASAAATANEIRPEYTASIVYGQLTRAAATESDAAAKEGKLALLKKMCAAFDNFKRYMEDGSSVIDHSMMWDIISAPNPNLFEGGNNMIVLELPENDDTHNVRILCPTNHYADQFFDHRKPTFFIIKKYKYYEPICLHIQATSTMKSIMYRFNLHNSSEHQVSGLFTNIKHAIETVRRTQRAYCAPIASGAAAAGYTQNYSASRIERILLRHDYAITTQVLNYDNRVIGFITEKSIGFEGMGGNKIWGYVPTEASELMVEFNALVAPDPKRVGGGQLPKYDIAYTDDATIEWQSYGETTAFLEHLHAETKLPCRPRIKVLDDSGTQIVGLITETNQFVRSIPEIDFAGAHDTATTKTAYASAVGVKGDHFLLDKVVLLNQPPFDPRRFKVANEVQLESNFYRAFRTTARHMLNQYSNHKARGVRKSLEAVLHNRDISYTNKIPAVIAMLKGALGEYVAFEGDYDTSAMNEVYGCISADSCKPGGSSRPAYCVYSDASNTCRLMIPKYKLETVNIAARGAVPPVQRRQQANEPIYYARLADELVRHERVRMYMFSSANYIMATTGDVRYSKCENEIMLMQSDINKNFLDKKENREDFMMDRIKNKNKNKGLGPEWRRTDQLPAAFKPIANTSFFNAKRADRVIGYDEQIANELLRNDAANDGPGSPHIVKRTAASLSKYVVDQLNESPAKFTLDVFEGSFPSAVGISGPVKETVNGTVTFAVMSNILHLEKLIDPNENVNKIKSVLCECYAELKKVARSGVLNPLERICKLFGYFGMQENADSILSGKYDDEAFVRSSRYVLTPFDIWLLAGYYRLPIIIMSDATEPDKVDAAFQSKLFRPARALYSTPEVDSESHYVIVGMRKLREFPVYGVLSYASAAGVEPTHIIPAAALHPLNETRPYSTPAELLKSLSSSSSTGPSGAFAAAAAANAAPGIQQYAAALGIEFGNESEGSQQSGEDEPEKKEFGPELKQDLPSQQPSLPMKQQQPQPQPQPSRPMQPSIPPRPRKSPIDVALSDSVQLVRKSLTGLKAATVASADTVETRVAGKLQSDLAELDDKITAAAAAAAAADAASGANPAEKRGV